MATKNQQVADQTLKGAVVGAISYILAKLNVDPGAQAALMPVVITGLAYASTKVGTPGTANFLDRAAKELPAVVAEVEQKVAEQKAVAKKTAAKKATAKKTAPEA